MTITLNTQHDHYSMLIQGRLAAQDAVHMLQVALQPLANDPSARCGYGWCV